MHCFFLLSFLFSLASAVLAEGEALRSWSIVRKEQGLMVNYVASIAEAQDGAIWMATAAGVSRFDGRAWEHHTAQDGLPGFLVTHVHVDGDGVVWAASGEGYPTFSDPWLARFSDGVWKKVKLPGRRARVRQIIDVAQGGIFVSSREGIFHLKDGQVRQMTVEEGLSVNSVTCMVERPDGTVLAAHSDRRRGQGPVEEGRGAISSRGPSSDAWDIDPLGDGLDGMAVAVAAQDPEGGLWFGTRGDGIRVFAKGTWRSITTADGLPSNTITVLTISRSGEVWAGSTAGVAQLGDYRDATWRVFSERDVLPSDGVTAIVPISDGSVWVATRAGAARYSDTGWIHHKGPFEGTRRRVSVELSMDGDLWASTEEGLFHFVRENWRLEYAFPDPMPVFDLVAGHDGSMWALTPRSIVQLRDSKWESVDIPLPTLDPRGGFRAITSRRGGGCWLGSGSGVYSYKDQKLERLDIDIDGPVRRLFEQSDGTLWIGGLWDLYRYRNGELTRVKAIETYGLTGPEAIMETSVGDLWVAFISGVWRLRDGDWEALPEGQSTGFEGTSSMFESSRGTVWLASQIEGAIHTDGATWTRYGAKSGLPSSSVWDVTEDAEGNLWFATQGGLGCYRPDMSPPETELLDPPVKVAPLEPVYMRLAARDSWLGTPEDELQFSWRIDGGEWSAFSTENRLLMDRLPSGVHRFEVRSLDRQFNIDPTPAAVTFEVLAPVIFRPWFVALSGFSALALVLTTGAAVQRSRRLKQAQQRLIDDLEAELQEAHEMQMSLLPSSPIETESVQAAGRCVPANHVGGDFYSFDWMGSGETFVVSAADVSGKAMKAAVRVMQLSGMYRYELRADRTPAQVLKGLHWSLLDHLDSASFVTGCLASVNVESGHVALANGGHPYPILLTKEGALREIEMPSMPLGITLPFGVTHNVAEQTIEMESGDTLIFYSDGITDLQDESGEFYGEDRFLASLKRFGGKSPTELVHAVMDEVGKFKETAPQADDVTVVAVRWSG